MSTIGIKRCVDWECESCGTNEGIVDILWNDTSGDVDSLTLCRACAIDLVHKLKTEITNDLLNIGGE